MKAERQDLIGFGPKCLIRPKRNQRIEPSKNINKNNREVTLSKDRSAKKKTIRSIQKKKRK